MCVHMNLNFLLLPSHKYSVPVDGQSRNSLSSFSYGGISFSASVKQIVAESVKHYTETTLPWTGSPYYIIILSSCVLLIRERQKERFPWEEDWASSGWYVIIPAGNPWCLGICHCCQRLGYRMSTVILWMLFIQTFWTRARASDYNDPSSPIKLLLSHCAFIDVC